MSVYSNMALAEVARTNDVTSSAAQFMIEAHRLDLSLFNAVIECDFAEAMGKAGLIAFTEADEAVSTEIRKKGIIQKIKELIDKAIAFIKRKSKEVMDAIRILTDKDKLLIKKFGSAITKESIKGCPAKGKVPNKAALDKFLNEYINNTQDINTIIDSIDKAKSVDEIDAIVVNFTSIVAEANKEISGKMVISSFFNDDDSKTIVEKLGNDADNLDIIVDNVITGYKKNLAMAKEGTTFAMKYLENMKKEIKSKEKVVQSELSINKINAASKCITALTNHLTKLEAFNQAVIKEFAMAYRNVFAQLGTYAIKGANKDAEEAKTESFAIEVLSNAVVEEAFEF